jgi:Beta protein
MTGAPIQIPLLKPEVLDPLPIDTNHYVAVLQSKVGEREALAHASPAIWERLTPLVAVVGPKNPKLVLSKGSVTQWVMNLWHAIGVHPFYLDILRLDPMHPVAAKSNTDPVLARMFAEARKRRMRFIPVVHVGQSIKSHVQVVADAVLEDGNGVALRCRIRKVLPSASGRYRDILSKQLDDVGAQPGDTDLLLDLEFIDKDDEIHPDDIAHTLREMCDVGHWRCIVLIGTSIPKMLGGPNGVKEGSVGTLPRREWDLWSQLARCDLPRCPAFGDYGIQHPEPPADDIGGNTMRANVRYTATSETIIARGRGAVSEEGSKQYHGLCKQIVARSEFSGGAYSWGDSLIDECAEELCEPGSQGLWRGAGTSHHLQFVTDALQLQVPSS